ncbi:hypothetical protein SADUNF_Sadunf19G0103100 [Salix dunnii]|uniref:Ribosomal protein S19 n=1 Tax=Salix dunnii TaxID=1413687 RepID=A0A835J4V2_9ROSI|nr:hypothetical protein SADUNF_Sadunf19G0103100 [Salix dunnii]
MRTLFRSLPALCIRLLWSAFMKGSQILKREALRKLRKKEKPCIVGVVSEVSKAKTSLAQYFLNTSSSFVYVTAVLFQLLPVKLQESGVIKKRAFQTEENCSRRLTILPEFVNISVRIYNGKAFVRTKISEGKVGHKFGEFCFYSERKSYEKQMSEWCQRSKTDGGGGAEGSNDGYDNRDSYLTAVNAFITRVMLVAALQVNHS